MDRHPVISVLVLFLVGILLVGPTEGRTPARKARFSTCIGLVCVRHGLSAGGRRIRTIGPSRGGSPLLGQKTSPV